MAEELRRSAGLCGPVIVRCVSLAFLLKSVKRKRTLQHRHVAVFVALASDVQEPALPIDIRHCQSVILLKAQATGVDDG